MSNPYLSYVDQRAEELGIQLSEDQRQELALDHENQLAITLENLTNPNHADYDADFDKEIRAMRPDWFENKISVAGA